MQQGTPIRNGLRLVAEYARTQRRSLSIAVAGSVVYAAGSVASANVLGWATNNTLVPLYDGGDVRLWAAVALIIGVMVVRSGGVIFRRFFAGLTAANARADLQRGIARCYVRTPLDHIKSRAPGDLLARLDSDTHAATEVIHPLPFTVGVLSMLLFAVLSLSVVDIPLTLTTMGLLPLIALTTLSTASLLERATDAERSANADVSAAAAEIIAGSQIIKTLGREDAELDHFAEVVDRHRKTRVRLQTMHAIIDDVLSFLPQAATVVIILVGSLRVSSGSLNPGGLVQAVALFGVLAFPMQVIGFFMTDLPVSVVGRQRVDSMLDEPTDPLLERALPIDGGDPLPPGPLGATLRAVTVTDGDRDRISAVDLDIEPGETLAIVGPTASGKSTIVELLARLRGTDSGSIDIGGADLETLPDAALRSRVTLASQQAVLRTGTVLQNTEFGRNLSADELIETLHTSGAGELDSTLVDGFQTVVGERGVTLSGGQRQRIALARALAGSPGMVLLDDATSAVDPAIEEQILQRLADLPTTVVMVTHRVAAMAAADRVALMVDGQLAAIGTHTDLLDHPEYARLVEAYQTREVIL
ncbi:MAG: ABC transporter ATP-binding protein [Actinomycetia bacterium]|nr:ABC transporter ATP-binding protein [Actinomycetes bacterium]MCP4962544.1 ABC transporter ATP-binding protein [Actinomycetes bacterium]